MRWPIVEAAIGEISRKCESNEPPGRGEVERGIYIKSEMLYTSITYSKMGEEYVILMTAPNPEEEICNLGVVPLVVFGGTNNTLIKSQDLDQCFFDYGMKNWTLNCHIDNVQIGEYAQNTGTLSSLRVLTLQVHYIDVSMPKEGTLYNFFFQVTFHPSADGPVGYPLISLLSHSYFLYERGEPADNSIKLCARSDCLEFEDNWRSYINENTYILIRSHKKAREILKLGEPAILEDIGSFAEVKEIDWESKCPEGTECRGEVMISYNNTDSKGDYLVHLGIQIGEIYTVSSNNQPIVVAKALLFQYKISLEGKKNTQQPKTWWVALIIILSCLLILIFGCFCLKRCSSKDNTQQGKNLEHKEEVGNTQDPNPNPTSITTENRV